MLLYSLLLSSVLLVYLIDCITVISLPWSTPVCLTPAIWTVHWTQFIRLNSSSANCSLQDLRSSHFQLVQSHFVTTIHRLCLIQPHPPIDAVTIWNCSGSIYNYYKYDAVQLIHPAFVTHSSPKFEDNRDAVKLRHKRGVRFSRFHRRSRSGVTFEQAGYTVNVSEAVEPHTLLIRVRALDPDHQPIFYTMLSPNNLQSVNLFSLNRTTGELKTAARLDRESMHKHVLRVTATQVGNDARFATCTVTVFVLDENDNAPSFERQRYMESVSEEAEVGRTVLHAHASDADQQDNAKIIYTFLDKDMKEKDEDDFSINPETGRIEVRRQLDREKEASYTLTVQARDSGHPPQASYAIVQISVLDSNDNAPQFDQPMYRAEILENADWQTKPVIVTTKAVDPDADENGQIHYSIVSGNSEEKFSIEFKSGKVRLNGPLDHKRRSMYHLIIRAQDSGTKVSHSTTVRVDIEVLDVNDHSPQFFKSVFQESVSEDVTHGSQVLRIFALDSDSGVNALLNYSLIVPDDQKKGGKFPFAIDADSGWIYVTEDGVDREHESLYDFEAEARDGGTPPLASRVRVVINVDDINDNAPRFEHKHLNVSVYENATVGMQLDVRISAYDPDESSTKLEYSIIDGNDHQQFQLIDLETRALLAVNRPLDCKRQSVYILVITARDAGNLKDTATVQVTVLDVNSPPFFDARLKHSCEVPENAPLGTTVVVITAYDNDFEDNAVLHFKLDPAVAAFAMDNTTGVITVNEELDKETTAFYDLRVSVYDQGDPPLTATTSIQVKIADINDNAPVFHQHNYTVHVSEDANKGFSFMQVTATDDDVDTHNHQIVYEFADESDKEGPFIIDASSGTIRITEADDVPKQPLDREKTAAYEFEVRAVDKGTPSLSAKTMVTVIVDDVNDNPPSFDQTQYSLFVPENEPVGTVAGVISAHDPDEGKNAHITFKISGGPHTSLFELRQIEGTNQVHIITRDEFDFEARQPNSPYRFQLQASSGDKIGLATVDVQVYVTDTNDHHPNLEDFWIYLNNFDGHFPLDRVGKVPAHDPDKNDTLTYSLVGSGDLLYVDKHSGQITLGQRLNTNRRIRANMTLIVTDGINVVAASLNLRVVHVSQEMLSHSVTIKIMDVSVEDVLDAPAFRRVVDALSTLGPSATDDVIIFSVQENEGQSLDSPPSVNVTFSIFQQDSMHFFSSVRLRELLHVHSETIARVGHIKFQVVDEELCVREPCLNFEQCSDVLKFSSAPDFMITSNMLIRPIHPVSTFTCTCPQGFASSTSQNLCDVEVDLCFSSPCAHDSTCISKENGYTCLCPPNFTGSRCDLPLNSEFCLPDVCASNSRCTVSNGHMRCADCQHSPKFSTPLCELTTRNFDGNAFITLPALQHRHRFTIKLSFASVSPNGLLLYNGRYKGMDDFLSVGLIGGSLEIAFSLGGPNVVTGILSPVEMGSDGILYDGQWHTVTVTYFNRTVVAFMDDCDPDIALNYAERIAYPKCALKLEYKLEEKCSDPMVLCHRLLDLNSPVYIGGIPLTYDKRIPIVQHNFTGCIQNVMINDKLIDLNRLISNHHSTPGCEPLQHGCEKSRKCSQCKDQWHGKTCSCRDGYSGHECSTPVKAYHLKTLDSYVVWNVLGVAQTSSPVVGLTFRTYKTNGLLFTAEFSDRNMLQIKICESTVCIFIGQQKFRTTYPLVSDGLWHSFELQIGSNHVNLTVDHVKPNTFDVDSSSYFYGSIENLYTGSFRPGRKSEPYIGCVHAAYITRSKSGPKYLDIEDRDYFHTEDGCSGEQTCASADCPIYSHCIQHWNRHTCKCLPGYAGERCIDICQLYPCQNGGECLKTSSGFACRCARGYSGRLCQQKRVESGDSCPAGWWGQPLCGPCNCNINLAFSPQCHKLTGKCKCQLHHYQPVGSSKCMPCDCYSGGSLSKSCDARSGQCQCKGDAIGYKCDACHNPKAQINKTTGYCEVVHYGCPENYAAGILWPRSATGSLMLADCPSSGSGLAQRTCQTNGWTRPNLNNCSSAAAETLRQMLLKFDSGVDVTSFDLRRASQMLYNSTSSLAQGGSFTFYADMRIAYRLLSTLLHKEMDNERLALTHIQDNSFIHDIVKTASNLLSPENRAWWYELGDGDVWTPVGHLLNSLDEYGALLSTVHASHMSYLKPFQVVAQHLTFSVESVHTVGQSKIYLPAYEVFRMDPITSTVRIGLPLQPAGTGSPGSAFFAVYNSVGQLTSDPHTYSTRVLSPVLSLAVSDTAGKLVTDLQKPVDVIIPVTMHSLKDKPLCVWWQQQSNSWKQDGCEFSWWNKSHGLCSCDHLTTFTIINSPDGFVQSTDHSWYLMAGGSGVSLIIVTVTLILICVSSVTPISPSHKLAHSCLIISLFLNIVAFFLVYSADKSTWLCPISGSVVHFSSISSLAWVLGSLLCIYKMATEPMHIARNMHLWPLALLGWIVPLLIALGTWLVGYSGLMETKQRCYFDIQDPLIWALLVPVCLSIILCGYTACVCLAVAWSSEWNLLLAKMNFRGILTSYFLLMFLVLVTTLLQLAVVNWPWAWLIYAYVACIVVLSLSIFILLWFRSQEHYDFRLVPGELWMGEGQRKDSFMQVEHSPECPHASPRPHSPYLSDDLAPRNEDDSILQADFGGRHGLMPNFDLVLSRFCSDDSRMVQVDERLTVRPAQIVASMKTTGTYSTRNNYKKEQSIQYSSATFTRPDLIPSWDGSVSPHTLTPASSSASTASPSAINESIERHTLSSPYKVNRPPFILSPIQKVLAGDNHAPATLSTFGTIETSTPRPALETFGTAGVDTHRHRSNPRLFMTSPRSNRSESHM